MDLINNVDIDRLSKKTVGLFLILDLHFYKAGVSEVTSHVGGVKVGVVQVGAQETVDPVDPVVPVLVPVVVGVVVN